jgi:hypothetical protein
VQLLLESVFGQVLPYRPFATVSQTFACENPGMHLLDWVARERSPACSEGHEPGEACLHRKACYQSLLMSTVHLHAHDVGTDS